MTKTQLRKLRDDLYSYPMQVAEGLLRVARWAEQESERLRRQNPRDESRENEWLLLKQIRESIEKAIEKAIDRQKEKI